MLFEQFFFLLKSPPQDRTCIFYAMSGCPGINLLEYIATVVIFDATLHVRGKCLRSLKSDHKMN